MSTQQQDVIGRPDRSKDALPTGAALLPVLQILALMCLTLFWWSLVESVGVSEFTGAEMAAL